MRKESQVAMVPTASREPAFREPRGGESEAEFELQVLPAGRMALATVVGPLDLAHAARFRAELQALPLGCRRVVLDLRRTAYVDSDGIRALLQLQETMRDRGTDLRLVAQPRGRVRRTLELLRLDGQFSLFDGLMEAWIERAMAA